MLLKRVPKSLRGLVVLDSLHLELLILDRREGILLILRNGQLEVGFFILDILFEDVVFIYEDS